MMDVVFIWIPKNAGTTIYQALADYGCRKIKRRKKTYRQHHGILTFGHMNYRKLIEANSIDKKAFKFCFVRNPYARFVSLYINKKANHEKISKMTFSQFVDFVTSTRIDPVDLYNSKGISTCNPQIRWIEGVGIDFLGKVEHLQRDFSNLLPILDLPDKKLGWYNKSHSDSYEKYYTKQDKSKIARLYWEDFLYFDYPM